MNSKADFIAAMKDEKYWNERAEKLFKSIEKNEEQLNKKLAEYYKVEAERLNKLIASYYAKYGKENVIQYRELLKKLSDGERKLLIEDIDKFIEKYPKYEKLKKVRESIYKLDRLEGLKVSINLSQMELAEKEVEEVKKYLEDVYKTGFDYANKELGYPTNFNSYNKEAVEKFINKSWVGGINFSKRIYNNRDKVSKWVMTEFADGVKRGESYDSLIKKMMNRFQEVSKSSAKRLVTTEASYILNESSMKVFEDEFDEYKYNAMLDAKTSKLCRRLDGEVYKISERKAGKNFPPMHPNCRSSFTIVIPDDWMDRAIEKHYKKDKSKNISGAVYYERDNSLDKYKDKDFLKKEKHAYTQFNAIKNRNREKEVSDVYENIKNISGMEDFTKEDIQIVYKHVFDNKYELEGGLKNFDPDYDMAQSFQRLKEGKNIQKHDLTMLRHERMEYDYMNKEKMSYNEAHEKTEIWYNYSKEVSEFLKEKGRK